jgi:hypothetical protein
MVKPPFAQTEGGVPILEDAMGENPSWKRNYRREYDNWASKPGNMKEHSARVKARREMVKEYGKEHLAGKDIDHVVPLRDKIHNTRANWRVSSERANRNWRKGKKGYD